MCTEGINQIGMDLRGAQTQFHFIDQFSFFIGSERRDNICSMLETKRSYNIFIGWQILIYSQDVPSSGSFIWFISTTEPTLVGVMKRCNSTSSSQPFWGGRDKSLTIGNYVTVICKGCFTTDPGVLCPRSLTNAFISICWMVKRLRMKQLSGETVRIPNISSYPLPPT